MSTTAEPRYEAIRDALATAEESSEPTEALPHLRAAADRLTDLIDDTMARAPVTDAPACARSAPAPTSENAVSPGSPAPRCSPRMRNESGRVTASGVERARYDHETGRTPESGTDPEPRPPMRFRPRRTT